MRALQNADEAQEREAEKSGLENGNVEIAEICGF